MNALLAQLFPDRPYFEGGTAGRQCTIARHAEIASFVSLLERPRVDILEIGSWIGHSALTWSDAIAAFCADKGTVVCVDPWAPYFGADDQQALGPYQQMESVARAGLAYDLFLHNTKFAAPGVEIRHLRGSLGDYERFLGDATFDLVYIDGSHYRDDVLSDLRLSERLLRDGGILCGDDLELQLPECDEAFARKHPRTDFVADPRTGTMFHPGVAVAVHDFFGGRVWSENGVWAMRKAAARTFSAPRLDARKFLVPRNFPDMDRITLANALRQAGGAR